MGGCSMGFYILGFYHFNNLFHGFVPWDFSQVIEGYLHTICGLVSQAIFITIVWRVFTIPKIAVMALVAVHTIVVLIDEFLDSRIYFVHSC